MTHWLGSPVDQAHTPSAPIGCSKLRAEANSHLTSRTGVELSMWDRFRHSELVERLWAESLVQSRHDEITQ